MDVKKNASDYDSRQPAKAHFIRRRRTCLKQTLMTVLLAVASATTSASAQCLSDAQVSDLVANYVAKSPPPTRRLVGRRRRLHPRKVNNLLAQRMGRWWATRPG